jgi:uncharacterized LabA/DUF88 family protein
VSETANRVVVFIDAENLIISAQKQGTPVSIKGLIDRIREEGILSSARAYADWTLPAISPYLRQFAENVVELSQLGSYYGKNTGDMQIVLDALELATGPAAPETFVIVSGDRDYVPLILRLKRYGKRVIGIGLSDTTSMFLRSACDQFLSYETLTGVDQPEGDVAKNNGVEVESAKLEISERVEDAFNLLLRAVVSHERMSRIALGTSVRQQMQQLDPGFDFSTLPFPKFKDLVQSAERHGYVRIAGNQGLDIKLESLREYTVKTDEPVRFLGTIHTSTSEVLQAYRGALEAKRVPLIPWRERQLLVRGMWQDLEESPEGLTLEELTNVMANIAASQYMYLPKASLSKISFSLNLGRALLIDGHEQYRSDIDVFRTRVRPSCDADEALRRINLSYIRGIHMDFPQLPLQQRALALLLYDSDGDNELSEVDELLHRP